MFNLISFLILVLLLSCLSLYAFVLRFSILFSLVLCVSFSSCHCLAVIVLICVNFGQCLLSLFHCLIPFLLLWLSEFSFASHFGHFDSHSGTPCPTWKKRVPFTLHPAYRAGPDLFPTSLSFSSCAAILKTNPGNST